MRAAIDRLETDFSIQYFQDDIAWAISFRAHEHA